MDLNAGQPVVDPYALRPIARAVKRIVWAKRNPRPVVRLSRWFLFKRRVSGWLDRLQSYFSEGHR